LQSTEVPIRQYGVEHAQQATILLYQVAGIDWFDALREGVYCYMQIAILIF